MHRIWYLESVAEMNNFTNKPGLTSISKSKSKQAKDLGKEKISKILGFKIQSYLINVPMIVK